MRTHPSTKQIVKRIAKLERHLNKLRIVPATRRLRSAVILPLLSKGLTVGRAICVLIDAGFPAEALAMSRTLLELVFSVRYITNKYTEERATKYVKYQARVNFEWMNIAQKHFPHKAAKLPKLDPFTLEIAREFDTKSNWTGERGQTKLMATEEDAIELDDHGRGHKNEFDYDGLYFWTSQYVHATIAGVGGHTCKRGEVFRVRIRKLEERECGPDALFITVVALCKIFIHAFRSMNETQPEAIQELYKMIRKFYLGKRVSTP